MRYWAWASDEVPDWLRIEELAAHTEVEDVQPEDIAALGARRSLLGLDLGRNMNLLLRAVRHVARLEWALMLMTGDSETEPVGSVVAVGASGLEIEAAAVGCEESRSWFGEKEETEELDKGSRQQQVVLVFPIV